MGTSTFVRRAAHKSGLTDRDIWFVVWASVSLLVATTANAQTNRILSCDGPFAPMMTAVSLAEVFGKTNVATEDVHEGEGLFQRGTLLFANSPQDRVEILWNDVEGQRDPRLLMLRGLTSNWRTRAGLTLGLRLNQVERINRGPFRLVGFRWDYGGTTMSWSGGVLEISQTPTCPFRARFGFRERDFGPVFERWIGQVSGERQFSSGHLAMQALNPIVFEIFVRYPER